MILVSYRFISFTFFIRNVAQLAIKGSVGKDESSLLLLEKFHVLTELEAIRETLFALAGLPSFLYPQSVLRKYSVNDSFLFIIFINYL